MIKFFTIFCVLFSLQMTQAFADHGNAQPAKDANGETQTTIIDENGNLKMVPVDKNGEPILPEKDEKDKNKKTNKPNNS